MDYISDIHVNAWLDPQGSDHLFSRFASSLLPSDPADILLVGGDLGSHNALTVELLGALSEHYKHIVAVLGNHDVYLVGPDEELYATSTEKVEALKADIAALDCVTLLDKSSVCIDGITIAGTSGWCDFTYRVDWTDEWEMGKSYYDELADLHCISSDFFGFSAKALHSQSFETVACAVRAFAEDQKSALRELSKNADILLTHYPGNRHLVSPKWERDLGTAFFFMNCSDFGLDKKVWVSGHTHDQYDIMHKGTRYLNNAYGYPRENPKVSGIKSFEIQHIVIANFLLYRSAEPTGRR
ncbi:MAG: metallophosphoesterase [Coriobacteriia bacterium]|nr:metallophosphoesterase [Coriobacteriia bacterium]